MRFLEKTTLPGFARPCPPPAATLRRTWSAPPGARLPSPANPAGGPRIGLSPPIGSSPRAGGEPAGPAAPRPRERRQLSDAPSDASDHRVWAFQRRSACGTCRAASPLPRPHGGTGPPPPSGPGDAVSAAQGGAGGRAARFPPAKGPGARGGLGAGEGRAAGPAPGGLAFPIPLGGVTLGSGAPGRAACAAAQDQGPRPSAGPGSRVPGARGQRQEEQPALPARDQSPAAAAAPARRPPPASGLRAAHGAAGSGRRGAARTGTRPRSPPGRGGGEGRGGPAAAAPGPQPFARARPPEPGPGPEAEASRRHRRSPGAGSGARPASPPG